MAFTDFTLDRASKTFGLAVQRFPFFTDVMACQSSSWLLETLQRGQPMAFISDKSRAENMIAPILLEVYAFVATQISVYVGQPLDFESSRGLDGHCDYVFVQSVPVSMLQVPIVCLVSQAKRQDIEYGYGEIVAQLVAAQAFNEREEASVPVLYGCISTGETWQFLRLKGKNIELDFNRYYISNLPELLGIFKLILEQFLP